MKYGRLVWPLLIAIDQGEANLEENGFVASPFCYDFMIICFEILLESRLSRIIWDCLR